MCGIAFSLGRHRAVEVGLVDFLKLGADASRSWSSKSSR